MKVLTNIAHEEKFLKLKIDKKIKMYSSFYSLKLSSTFKGVK